MTRRRQQEQQQGHARDTRIQAMRPVVVRCVHMMISVSLFYLLKFNYFFFIKNKTATQECFASSEYYSTVPE